ncbi:hypothetical protein DMC30DRAFT_398515 [Rhodotorula diobovata]|uniref:Uncharacterized protein n=1 Tax=Rhodotorula diobovata TaxID=5288 RepID=A0A5C5FUT9_9BASI|nr:hypothetical protein DMC30DRAFT_398515 [Rhodotorula diobovata]
MSSAPSCAIESRDRLAPAAREARGAYGLRTGRHKRRRRCRDRVTSVPLCRAGIRLKGVAGQNSCRVVKPPLAYPPLLSLLSLSRSGCSRPLLFASSSARAHAQNAAHGFEIIAGLRWRAALVASPPSPSPSALATRLPRLTSLSETHQVTHRPRRS